MIDRVVWVFAGVLWGTQGGACEGPYDSCGQEADLLAADTVSLSYDLISDSLLARVSDLHVVGEHLLLAHGEVTPHLTLVHRQSGAVVNKMGSHGRSRTQLEYPACVQSLNPQNSTVSLADIPTNRILTLAFSPDGRADVTDVTQITGPESLGCGFRLGDQIVLSAGFPDRLLHYFDDGGVLQAEQHVDEPPFPGEIPFNSALAARQPSGGAMVKAYRYLSRVDFIDDEGVRRMSVETDVTPPRSHVAYVSLAATDDYVYLGHCGCNPDDGQSLLVKRIDILDWNGELVGDIILDTRVAHFAVEPNGNVLYASYLKNGDWKIGVWALR